MAEWQDHLDQIVGAVARLDAATVGIPRSEAATVALALREANKNIWKIVNELDANYVNHLYDMGEILKAIAAAEDIDPADVFVSLVEVGALKLNEKKLLSQAHKWGVDVKDYETPPHPQGDTDD